MSVSAQNECSTARRSPFSPRHSNPVSVPLPCARALHERCELSRNSPSTSVSRHSPSRPCLETVNVIPGGHRLAQRPSHDGDDAQWCWVLTSDDVTMGTTECWLGRRDGDQDLYGCRESPDGGSGGGYFNDFQRLLSFTHYFYFHCLLILTRCQTLISTVPTYLSRIFLDIDAL